MSKWIEDLIALHNDSASPNYSQAQIDGMIAELDAHAARDPLLAGVQAEDPRTWREVYGHKLVTDYDVVRAWSFLPAADDDWMLDPESFNASA